MHEEVLSLAVLVTPLSRRSPVVATAGINPVLPILGADLRGLWELLEAGKFLKLVSVNVLDCNQVGLLVLLFDNLLQSSRLN